MQGVSRSNSGLALLPLFTFGYISCTLGVGPSCTSLLSSYRVTCTRVRSTVPGLTLVFHAAHLSLCSAGIN